MTAPPFFPKVHDSQIMKMTSKACASSTIPNCKVEDTSKQETHTQISSYVAAFTHDQESKYYVHWFEFICVHVHVDIKDGDRPGNNQRVQEKGW